MTTICIQIGNSDNKLSQQEWSSFCKNIHSLCEGYGMIHFSGGSSIDDPWQNYCICVETDQTEELKELVSKRREVFFQDSVAWVEGNVQFI